MNYMIAENPSKDPCFIDSNLWIYAATQSQDSPPDPRHDIARNLIQLVHPCLSVQVINEVSINLKRKHQFTESSLKTLIQSFFDRYPVFPLDKNTLLQGSLLRESYPISFWDSLIIASAILHNCRTLYSEDMHHSLVINEQLTIINPFKA
jgi:predicted nucleic acid-binding protein